MIKLNVHFKNNFSLKKKNHINHIPTKLISLEMNQKSIFLFVNFFFKPLPITFYYLLLKFKSFNQLNVYCVF